MAYSHVLMGSEATHAASPVASDGKIYVPSEAGEILVLKAGRRYELLDGALFVTHGLPAQLPPNSPEKRLPPSFGTMLAWKPPFSYSAVWPPSCTDASVAAAGLK